MSRIVRNISAGFASNIWGSVVSVVAVPLYIHYLGFEAYGLVGLYSIVQGMLRFLDFGMSTTLNRELSVLSTTEDPGQKMRDLVRSLGTVFWAVGIALGIALVVAAPWGRYWVEAEELSDSTITHAVMLVGAIVTLQWPRRLYNGGLFGLQRHDQSATINIACATIRAGGSVAILAFVSPTIEAFFLWQAFSSALNTYLIARALSRAMPPASRRPSFSRPALKRVWRFAAGVSLTSVLATLLSQLDKVVVSKFVPLREFGFYTLAVAGAAILYRVRTPVSQAVFPRLAAAVAAKDFDNAHRLFHRSSQLVSLLVLPPALTLIAFAPQVLWLWTGDADAVQSSAPILRFLAAAAALQCLQGVPYTLQLAHGWTALGQVSTFIGLLVALPAAPLAVSIFGAPGAAAVWAGVNAMHVLVTLQFMFNRLCPGERWHWYLHDTAGPAAASAVVVTIGWLVIPAQGSWLSQAFAIGTVGLAALGATGFAAPEGRRLLTKKFRGRFGKRGGKPVMPPPLRLRELSGHGGATRSANGSRSVTARSR